MTDLSLGARWLRARLKLTLRNPRTDSSRAEWTLWRLRRRVGVLFPQRVRNLVARAAKLGDHDPVVLDREAARERLA